MNIINVSKKLGLLVLLQIIVVPVAISDVQLSPEEQAQVDGITNSYSECVNTIISRSVEVAFKRTEINAQCNEKKIAVSLLFPEEIRSLAMLNLDRRIDAVLSALEEIEYAIVDTVEDAQAVGESLNEDSIVTSE